MAPAATTRVRLHVVEKEHEVMKTVSTHAEEDDEPAGDVSPEGHGVQDVALPPDEYVFAVHSMHDPALR